MLEEAIGEMPSLQVQRQAEAMVRRTRTAFLAGGRGTGKTTVLTSLMRDTESGKHDENQVSTDVQSILRVRGRIVWLETLDMEPLPRNTNLLAAILIRLEDAARRYGASPEVGEPRGLLEPSSEYHQALLELQRLQTDVALAWDGNLHERQGQLDPDAYAVEMMRTERARLSLNQRFGDTLHRLAKYVFRRQEIRDPLFVLTVDDFDLNPPNCLDLLRVLRLISVPRLFTIMMGDLEVANNVLALKLSDDLGSIANPKLNHEMLAVEPKTVARIAGDVAANALRKLLPPGQRVELDVMSVAEAMNFKPLGADETTLYLHDLLGRCPILIEESLPAVEGVASTPEEKAKKPDSKSGLYRVSLRQLLLAPGYSWPPLATKERKKAGVKLSLELMANNAVYSGASFLRAPPRNIADTWLELNKIVGLEIHRKDESAELSKRLRKHFAHLALDALRETPAISPAERNDVERAIGQTIAGEWTLRQLPIQVRPETLSTTTIELRYSHFAEKMAEVFKLRTATKQTTTQRRMKEVVSGPQARILIGTGQGWEMVVSHEWESRLPGMRGSRDPWESSDAGDYTLFDKRGPQRTLPETAVSALILYHDLLAFGESAGANTSPLLNRSSLWLDWAVTVWNERLINRFPWPAPVVRSFFELDRFADAWRRVIGSDEITGESEPDRKVDRLGFAWLAAGTALINHTQPLSIPTAGAELPWEGLADQLERTAQQIGVGQHIGPYREWLLRVLELLMPEMGLPVEFGSPQYGAVTEFTSRESLVGFWQENHTIIQLRRAERLALLNLVASELAETLRGWEGGLAGQFIPTKEQVEIQSERYRAKYGISRESSYNPSQAGDGGYD
jgi:hypothetical protein